MKSPHFGLRTNGKEGHLDVEQSAATLRPVSEQHSICLAPNLTPAEGLGRQGQLLLLHPT